MTVTQNDWPSNELTNQFEKELLSVKRFCLNQILKIILII